MTTHPSNAELREFAAGELDPERAFEVEIHLGSCAECRDRRRRAGELVDSFDAAPREAAPAPIVGPARQGETAPRTRPRWLPAVGLAAAVLLFLAGLLLGRATATPEQVAAATPPDSAAAALPPADSLRPAAEVQRAGTAYVQSLAAFVALDAAPDAVQAQGREAALATLDAAARELAALSPGDPRMAAVLRSIEALRALGAAGAVRTVRF